ncbi:MAG: transporter ATP-binding protein [Actinomycetia bacterium]|nr:transporter ATP-binding protein [Actinomycetes bacterium]
MLAIEVGGLRKSYAGVEAVRDLSFVVEEGEVVAVLGPNGAGKTTTVEILEGYRDRDGGDVKVLGFDPAHGGAEYRARIGIVLQGGGFDPFLTVREMLTMYGGYYPAPRAVDEVVELVGLTEKAESRVRTLSGGQQRRLDLGLGLIGDPQLLFLDEPTTGFDPSARRHAWDLVRRMCVLGKTVLLTTHYMEEAQALADRVVVIAAGEKVAEGTPESIGGRATADVVIRFVLPASARVSDLPVAASEEGGRVAVVRTSTPTPVLHELTAWVLGRNEELVGLTVERPSLEDVYLELTGDDRTNDA